MKGLRKYTAAFLLAMEGAMEYRANFLLGMLSGIFVVVIQYFVWTALYGSSDTGVLFGYDYGQMVVYIIMAGLLSRIMATGFEREVAEDIKNGGLSRFLVQPIGYLPYRVMLFFGEKAVQVVLVGGISVLVLTALHIGLGVTFAFGQTGLFILAVLLGLGVNCLLFYCISSLAFWATEVSGVFVAVTVFANILSGGIFPLDVFGETAQKVFKLLPFQYVIYFPLNIITGKTLGGEAVWGLGMQLLWLAGLYLLSLVLWRAGMRRYIAVGG